MSRTNVLDYSIIQKPIFVQSKSRHLVIQFALDCNMKCSFCNQKNYQKSSSFNVDTLIENIKQVKQYYSKNGQYLELSLQGGEILQDKYLDTIFDQYQKVLDYCIASLKPNLITMHTNLLHTKKDRVVIFCQKNNIHLALSYDLVGRYCSKRQLLTVYKNAEYYIQQQIPLSIEIVLARSNINMFYQQQSLEYSIFEKLYALTKEIHFQFYGSDNTIQDNEVVSEQEIAQFFIWLDQHFPQCSDLLSFQSNYSKHKTDCFKTIVSDNSIIWTCCDPIRYKQFIQNHHCLSCVWYNRCQACACYRVLYSNKDCYQRILFEYFDAKKRSSITAAQI